jgi:hypothetical protein
MLGFNSLDLSGLLGAVGDLLISRTRRLPKAIIRARTSRSIGTLSDLSAKPPPSVARPRRVEDPSAHEPYFLRSRVGEFWVPVCSAAFGGEIEEIPERPQEIDGAVVLSGLGVGEAEFGVIRVVDFAVSAGKYV